MDEDRLDWKKVFKEILGKNPTPHGGVESKQNLTERSAPILSSETKNYQSSSQNTTKTFACKKSNAHLKSYGRIEQTYNLSNDRQSVEVPEWDKVFKNILGGNSSTCNAQEQNINDFSLKKSIPSRRHYVPAHKKRSYTNKKHSYSTSKLEMEAAEREVREMFAQSRLLKYDCSFKSLNDLAGTGVDIFKCEKNFISTFEEEKEIKVEPEEDSSSDQYIKPDFPLTGFVANIKPITRDDILNSPQLEITEWWDDDLFF